MKQKNGHIEPEMAPEDIALDAALSNALQVTPPEGLHARVLQASRHALVSDSNLERTLDQAFTTSTPEGLSQRVFASSVDSLCNKQEETPAVIARIGQFSQGSRWQQIAVAASIVLTTMIAIRFGMPTQPQLHDSVATHAELSVEEEGLLLDDFELSEFAYLADTRELAFADIADSFNSVRQDIELWQYGLLTE